MKAFKLEELARYEPVREKTNNLGFRPGPTQTGLCILRSGLEPRNFGFKKKRYCTICVAKTKALISFTVIAKLICAFVFAYAGCWFSHARAHILCENWLLYFIFARDKQDGVLLK